MRSPSCGRSSSSCPGSFVRPSLPAGPVPKHLMSSRPNHSLLPPRSYSVHTAECR